MNTNGIPSACKIEYLHPSSDLVKCQIVGSLPPVADSSC